MNKITLTDETMIIDYKKVIPFIKEIKIITKKVLLKDIKFITREEHKTDLKALIIYKKKGGALYLSNDKYEDLNKIYQLFLKHHSEENNYGVSIIDIFDMKETTIY